MNDMLTLAQQATALLGLFTTVWVLVEVTSSPKLTPIKIRHSESQRRTPRD